MYCHCVLLPIDIHCTSTLVAFYRRRGKIAKLQMHSEHQKTEKKLRNAALEPNGAYHVTCEAVFNFEFEPLGTVGKFNKRQVVIPCVIHTSYFETLRLVGCLHMYAKLALKSIAEAINLIDSNRSSAVLVHYELAGHIRYVATR